MPLPATGSVFAGYRIEDTAGRGGMGVVYRARQIRPDRMVALKVIAPEHFQNSELRQRFEFESQIAASLEHPNVIPVYDVDEAEDLLYIAMRFVDGSDLRELIGIGIEPRLAVDVIGQIAGALDAAHARGLVHRDVKPGNILVTETSGPPHAYLTDFGLTKLVESSGALTQSGAVMGTPNYMAPEQIEGERVDARTDVYALACVLFHAVTGHVPYPRDSQYATLFAHLNEPTPSPSGANPSLSLKLDEVIRRGMAKNPDERYPSAGDFGRAALAAVGAGEMPQTERTVATGDAAPAMGSLARTKAMPQPAPARLPQVRPGRRLLAVLLGVGAVALIALVAVAVTGGGSEDQPPQPSSAVGRVVGDPIPVQRNPVAVASGAGSVWVANARNGSVTRIDSTTATVDGAPIDVGREPSAVAVGADTVWVANGRDDTVSRLDARSGRPRGTPFPVGDQPVAIAIGEGAVWTANYGDGTVSRIDPDRAAAAAVHTIRVGLGPTDVAVGNGAVWVANSADDTLTRINPASRRVIGSPIPVGQSPNSLTVDSGAVWVANIDIDQVRKVDTSTNQVVGNPITVGERPEDVVVWNGGIYVANQDANSIVRIDPDSRQVVGSPLTVGNDPIALAPDGDNLWVLNFGAETVVKVEA
jgi:YVTN family beta-propeller protein